MTIKRLYLEDAYARVAEAGVIAHTPDGGVIVDNCLFYPTGGGQPGDCGQLNWRDNQMTVTIASKFGVDQIVLVPGEGEDLPPVGTVVTQTLDWAQRYDFMRVHTALHLLSVVIPLPVTGGAVSRAKGRIDFNMPEAPEDKAALEKDLQNLVVRDLPVTESWITEQELDRNPGLVKTMSVSPPRGAGNIRLVRIGQGADQVDLQPCGGTHVLKTGEIGALRLGKIEKKGRQNRRVYLHLDS